MKKLFNETLNNQIIIDVKWTCVMIVNCVLNWFIKVVLYFTKELNIKNIEYYVFSKSGVVNEVTQKYHQLIVIDIDEMF